MIRLPIDDIAPQLRDALTGRGPIVVAAPTGSGKSTRLPPMLHDMLGGPVLVVEPRRVACRALAERVSEERGSPLGNEVGYAIRFEEKRSPATRILFVTPGVALRLLADDGLCGFRALLIDEFHERGWQTDLVATLGRRPDAPTLVLTSATLDTEHLTRTLDATLLVSEGRTFPVDVNWSDEPAEPTRRDLAERVSDAVRTTLQNRDSGDILVFLPGRGEIRDAESTLGRLPPEVELHAVHGGVPLDRLQRAFRASDSRRRIYLATNIAETSLTLPGVTHVIDSGLERTVIHRAGRNVLALQAISLASMDQRAGRAGRVAPGTCLRLFSRRFRPRPDTSPELERIALDEVLVRAAAAGLDGPAFDEAPWITPPPEFAVRDARQRLQRAGLLDADHRLSAAGRALVPLPVDATDALLLQQPDPLLRAHLADLLCLRAWRRSPLLPLDTLPAARRETISDQRRQLFEGVTHEPAMLLRVLRSGDVRAHHLDASLLREARATAAQLRDAADAPKTRDEPDWRAVGVAIARAWPASVFVLRARARTERASRRRNPMQPWTNGEVEVEVMPFASPDDGDADTTRPPTRGVLLEIAWIGDGATGFRGRGSLLLPMREDDLLAAGAGVAEPGEVRLDTRSSPPRVLRTEELRIAEIVLAERERALTGPDLHDAAATLLLEGRLIRGVGERLRDQLHLAAIARTLPEPLQPAYRSPPTGDCPDAPQPWLRDRLAELGVERSADFQLLSADDLLPDLSALTGWPDFELDRLAEDFPRIWEHQGASWHCEVRAAAGRVTLHPRDRAAKNLGPPDVFVVPRFRNFRVWWKKAEREVRVR